MRPAFQVLSYFLRSRPSQAHILLTIAWAIYHGIQTFMQNVLAPQITLGFLLILLKPTLGGTELGSLEVKRTFQQESKSRKLVSASRQELCI